MRVYSIKAHVDGIFLNILVAKHHHGHLLGFTGFREPTAGGKEFDNSRCSGSRIQKAHQALKSGVACLNEDMHCVIICLGRYGPWNVALFFVTSHQGLKQNIFCNLRNGGDDTSEPCRPKQSNIMKSERRNKPYFNETSTITKLQNITLISHMMLWMIMFLCWIIQPRSP
jgi:hypothetical protein